MTLGDRYNSHACSRDEETKAQVGQGQVFDDYDTALPSFVVGQESRASTGKLPDLFPLSPAVCILALDLSVCAHLSPYRSVDCGQRALCPPGSDLTDKQEGAARVVLTG